MNHFISDILKLKLKEKTYIRIIWFEEPSYDSLKEKVLLKIKFVQLKDLNFYSYRNFSEIFYSLDLEIFHLPNLILGNIYDDMGNCVYTPQKTNFLSIQSIGLTPKHFKKINYFDFLRDTSYPIFNYKNNNIDCFIGYSTYNDFNKKEKIISEVLILPILITQFLFKGYSLEKIVDFDFWNSFEYSVKNNQNQKVGEIIINNKNEKKIFEDIGLLLFLDYNNGVRYLASIVNNIVKLKNKELTSFNSNMLPFPYTNEFKLLCINLGTNTTNNNEGYTIIKKKYIALKILQKNNDIKITDIDKIKIIFNSHIVNNEDQLIEETGVIFNNNGGRNSQQSTNDVYDVTNNNFTPEEFINAEEFINKPHIKTIFEENIVEIKNNIVRNHIVSSDSLSTNPQQNSSSTARLISYNKNDILYFKIIEEFVFISNKKHPTSFLKNSKNLKLWKLDTGKRILQLLIIKIEVNDNYYYLIDFLPGKNLILITSLNNMELTNEEIFQYVLGTDKISWSNIFNNYYNKIEEKFKIKLFQPLEHVYKYEDSETKNISVNLSAKNLFDRVFNKRLKD